MEQHDDDEPVYLSRPQVNERTVLSRIDEDSDRVSITQLQEELDTLLIERQQLENRMALLCRAFDDRATPFRDAFEEVRLFARRWNY